MLPAIFCDQAIRAFSSDGRNYTSDWLPWCVVDPLRGKDRPHTFLHEAGHAAGAVHNMDLAALPSDLIVDRDITTPATISDPVLELLGRAYFYW